MVHLSARRTLFSLVVMDDSLLLKLCLIPSFGCRHCSGGRGEETTQTPPPSSSSTTTSWIARARTARLPTCRRTRHNEHAPLPPPTPCLLGLVHYRPPRPHKYIATALRFGAPQALLLWRSGGARREQRVRAHAVVQLLVGLVGLRRPGDDHAGEGEGRAHDRKRHVG